MLAAKESQRGRGRARGVMRTPHRSARLMGAKVRNGRRFVVDSLGAAVEIHEVGAMIARPPLVVPVQKDDACGVFALGVEFMALHADIVDISPYVLVVDVENHS